MLVTTLLSETRYVGVLAMFRDQVVLVREEYAAWGAPFWNIPSGRVESHENLAAAASRELAEETGLVVLPADLALVGTTSVTAPGKLSRAWTFTVTVDDGSLDPQDPDGLIQEAGWFSREEAVAALGVLPYRPLSEPAVALLTGAALPGTRWTYPDPASVPRVAPPAT